MINELKTKIIKENKASEYEALGKLIMESPVEIVDFSLFEQNLKEIITLNKKVIKNKKYAIFYNLKKIVIGKKVFSFPKLENVKDKLLEEYGQETTAIILSDYFDQGILFYLGNKIE